MGTRQSFGTPYHKKLAALEALDTMRECGRHKQHEFKFFHDSECVMSDIDCKFTVGQLIQHLRFEYRGVVYDVDATFQGSEEWYQLMARSSPPKDRPWYHVLVHNSDHMTYVSERNLEVDSSTDPIEHPLIDEFFTSFSAGRYSRILS